MTKTKIEWADRVWNPTTGCTKVSAGCKHCYAERIAGRFWGERKFTDVQLHLERLDMPLHWAKPSRVFVNSMSDLFHEHLDLAHILTIFYRMATFDRHTYMVLTKRPKRMLELFDFWQEHIELCQKEGYGYFKPPLKNVWLGVSVENQENADERIPLLLRIPAAVRFVSIEPMLGDVDISPHLWGKDSRDYGYDEDPLDWVICGGESGPNARPMHPDWARSLRDQCIAAGVPFFFKQWGEWAENPYFTYTTPQKGMTGPWTDSNGDAEYFIGDGISSQHRTLKRVGKRAAGRLLDGREWNQYPEVG